MNKKALVFPGQGSQSLGMLSDLSQQFPIIVSTFHEVSSALGEDYWQLTQEGPVERLNQTAYTQVVMLAADIAVFRVLLECYPALSFDYFTGHSLGEYAALVAAKAISLKEAALLVRKRGELMQETVPLGVGAMAAIVGLSDEVVANCCRNASSETELVVPANYNTLGQVVVAGHCAAVDRAIHLAQTENARLAMLIPVSVPCHCDLLKPAAVLFSDILSGIDFASPEIPVLSSIDLSLYTTAEDIRRKLAVQLYSPVRWVQTIQALQKQGVGRYVECGPGKVLSGLIKRIDKSIQMVSGLDYQAVGDACLH